VTVAPLRIVEGGAEGGPIGRNPLRPVDLQDFRHLAPMNRWIYMPVGDLWPASSVNARVPPVPVYDRDGTPRIDKKGDPVTLPASQWLAEHRAVEQQTWVPGETTIIEDKLIAEGGWIAHPGARVFNLYRPPTIALGDASKAGPWIDHLRLIYQADAEHLLRWFAHRVQRPGEKVNHGIVLAGAPGIGKDTLLEPVKAAVGPWNFGDVSPVQLLGRFNGFLQSVILRVSEARDMGEANRFQVYEHCKTLLAAPPDVLRVDRKNVQEYAVPNVVGVVFTTNRPTDALYLPADDRRHYVAASEATHEDFDEAYWSRLWGWYQDGGGIGHVAAHLYSVDLSDWNPFAPPPKTAAFRAIVDAGRSVEDSDLADALDRLDWPEAVTLGDLESATVDDGFKEWLRDRKNRRQVPHRMKEAGYAPVRNDAAKDGFFKMHGRRQVVYARDTLTIAQQLSAARTLVEEAR